MINATKQISANILCKEPDKTVNSLGFAGLRQNKVSVTNTDTAQLKPWGYFVRKPFIINLKYGKSKMHLIYLTYQTS